jgi:Putative Ig domain
VQLRCLGGFPPCWYFKVEGLPPGLTLGSLAQVVGTPTTTGVYSVTFTVKDTRNVTASTSWKWTITP